MFQERIQLLKNANYRNLVISNFITVTGGGLCYIAITWYVLSLHNHISSVIINSLCFWLPATLFGPFVGNWIDGLPRKYVFFAASFTRAISFLIFATILAFSPHIYWCYTMSAINGFLYTIISPSSFAMVKEIVSRNQLTAANSTMDMVFEIGNIGGMGIAGILLQFLGITDLFYVVGAFIFIGTFFILAIKIKKENQLHHSNKITIFKDFAEAVSYLKNHPVISLLYLINLCAFIQFVTSPVILAPYVKFFLKQSAHIFSLIEMMLSAGIVLGNLFLPLLEKKIGWTNIILICICILGVDLFSLYCIHNTIYTLIIYGINGVCFTYWVFIVSKIQSLTTAHFQGRLQSLFTSVSATIVIIFYVILERSSHSITTVDCYLILSLFSIIAFIALFIIKLFYKQRI